MLKKYNRGIAPILGDGNCLFRALSKLTFWTEDWHALVRSLLMEFVSLNQVVFQEYCSEDIAQHILKMKHIRTWGGHVELQAASFLLKLPIYVLTQRDGNDAFYWEVFRPRQIELVFPETEISKPPGVHHYELCHSMRCHYDVITLSDGTAPVDPPSLEQQHSYMKLDD